jgi:hypothetical protein
VIEPGRDPHRPHVFADPRDVAEHPPGGAACGVWRFAVGDALLGLELEMRPHLLLEIAIAAIRRH